MSISNIKELRFVGGSFTQEEYRYRVQYSCSSDDGDGPDVIRRDPFFRIGKSYTFGNDRNPSARLKSVSPSLVSDAKRTYWVVECEFSTKQQESDTGGGGGVPGSGGTSDSPDGDLPVPNSLELRFIREGKEVTAAKFVSTVARTEAGDAPVYPAIGGPDGIPSYVGPPLNSALQPIEPRPTRYGTDVIYRLNVKTWASGWLDAVSETVGKINNAPFEIKAPSGIWRRTFPKHQIRLVDASHEPITWLNSGWVMFTLDFLYKPGGHYLDLVDEGTAVKNDMPEPETTGTESGRLPYSNAIALKAESIKDETGAAIAQPVLFDGTGKILNANGITYIQRYLEDKDIEADFSKLPTLPS